MYAPTQKMIEPDPVGPIYITSKARMEAEARLKHLDITSQILVGWYSLCIIAISLLDLSESYRVEDVGIFTAILSIGVLSTSIFLPGQNFAVRAKNHRECYLLLQAIYRSNDLPDGKMKEYAAVLLKFENHRQCDHDKVLFESFVSGKTLRDSDGAILVTKSVITRHVIRKSLMYLAISSFFIAPVVLAFMWTVDLR